MLYVRRRLDVVASGVGMLSTLPQLPGVEARGAPAVVYTNLLYLQLLIHTEAKEKFEQQ